MRLYKNGDRCPCCGQRIEGKPDDWLLLFSQTVDMLRIPPWEAQALADQDLRTAVRQMLTGDKPKPVRRQFAGKPVKTGPAAEARRAYKRKWAKENPDKIRAQQERYWEKRAARAAEGVGPYEMNVDH